MDGFDFDGWDWDGVGHHCHGWGFGWLIPALLVGKVISHVMEPEVKRAWPTPTPVVPPLPTPKSPPAPGPQPTPRPASQSGLPMVRCRHCDHDIQKGFAYCPHCGHQVSLTNCQYCGHKLLVDAAYCGHCGGPVR